MPYDIITVTPILATGDDAYADGEVLFTSTAVKLPYRKCKVVAIDAIFEDDQLRDTNDREFIALFFKENTHDLGSAGGSASITGAQMATNVYLGCSRLVNHGEDALNADSDVHVTLFKGQHLNDSGGAASSGDNIVITEGSTKNTCYIQGLYEVGENSAGTDTFAADALTITIGVEY
tara:strand:- start:223 stop:753 length:531 start_codon:yes stop_codon:yes gene_type:complete